MVYLGFAFIAVVVSQCSAHRDDAKAAGSQEVRKTQRSALQLSTTDKAQVTSNSTADQASSHEGAAEKAASVSDSKLNATDQEQAYAYVEASFHSTVDRLQSALHEEFQALKKDRRHSVKVQAKPASKSQNVSEHNSAVQLEAGQLEALIAENNELRRQQAEAKAIDVEDEIAKLHLWEDQTPDLQQCKISKSDDPIQTVDNLDACSKELMKAAKRTMESKDKSQAANEAYVEKFKKVLEIMQELADLKSLWAAFEKDHQNAQKTLVAKARSLEPVIKALGGGEAAKKYISSQQPQEEEEGA